MTELFENILLGMATNFAYDVVKYGAQRLSSLAFTDEETAAITSIWRTTFAATLQDLMINLDDRYIGVIEYVFTEYVRSKEVCEALLDLAFVGDKPPLVLLQLKFDSLEFDRNTLPINFDDTILLLTQHLTKSFLDEAKSSKSVIYNRISLIRIVAIQDLLKERSATLETIATKVAKLDNEWKDKTEHQAVFHGPVENVFLGNEEKVPSDFNLFFEKIRNWLDQTPEDPAPASTVISKTDDTLSTNVRWDCRDSKLLDKYLLQCAEYDPTFFKPLLDFDEVKLANYMINSGLICRSEDGHLYFTYAGLLLCCKREYIPRSEFYVHVKFQYASVSSSNNRELWGSVLYLYYELYTELQPLFQRRRGTPDIRNGVGGERVFYDYPEVALVEALVNFLIHRDYSMDDIGFITVYSDRIEFMNPGASSILPKELLESSKPLRPIYDRNPRLIEAINKARLNQREGSGILRIRQKLAENRSIFSNGDPGLLIENDNEKNRFLLSIYKRTFESEHTGSSHGTSQAAAIPFMVPAAPSYGIFGRDNYLQILSSLLVLDKPDVTDVPPVALYGLGGIGKTTIAIMFGRLESIRNLFPDGILWASLGPNPTIRLLLDGWGKALGIDLLPERDEESCRNRLRLALYPRRMLIIIDDVWEVNHGQYFMVAGPHCRTLLTTRETPIANELATRQRALRLDVLKMEDAIALLNSLAPEAVVANLSLCQQFCETVEFLPLALTLAGRLLADQADVPTQMTRLLGELIERRQARLHLFQSEQRPGIEEKKPSLQAILGMSVERLGKEDQDRFAMASVFGGEPLTWDLKAASFVWECSEDAAAETTTRFIQRGLVVRREERYWMHALLADYAAEMMEERGL